MMSGILSDHYKLVLFTLGALAVCLTAASGGAAQSGRRAPKQPLPIATPAPPTPVPTPVTDPPVLQKTSLKVIADLPQSAYLTFPIPENMQKWAIDRFRDSRMIDVRDAGQANRRDAIKAAKAETEAYTVYLLLSDDPFSRNGTGARPGLGETWIDLSIFVPNTGKQVLTKRVLLNPKAPLKPLPEMIKTCHDGVYGNDFLLLQASIEAAEIVMMHFGIPIPPDCPR